MASGSRELAVEIPLNIQYVLQYVFPSYAPTGVLVSNPITVLLDGACVSHGIVGGSTVERQCELLHHLLSGMCLSSDHSRPLAGCSQISVGYDHSSQLSRDVLRHVQIALRLCSFRNNL